MKYILGAKPGDHAWLFDLLEAGDGVSYHEYTDEKGILHQFHYMNEVSLNKSNPNTKVNFFEYEETLPNGDTTRFSWVTNILITEENVYQLMQEYSEAARGGA